MTLLCECGCGLPAPISNRTDRRVGAVRGQPRRYIQYHNGHVKADVTRHSVVEAGFSTSCWKWGGHIPKDGYGIIYARVGSARLAHRVSYEIAKGPIPAGLQIDHLCHNRWCINPDHLEAVTPAENNRRRLVKRKTHCPHGHEYSLSNTVITRKGSRICQICTRAGHRESQRRRRARIAEAKRKEIVP
jgi:HNH endonuclease